VAASLALAARLRASPLPAGGVCSGACSRAARLWRPGSSTRCCRHAPLSAPTLSGTRSLRLLSTTGRRDEACANEALATAVDSSAAALPALPPLPASRVPCPCLLPGVGLGDTATRSRVRAETRRLPLAAALGPSLSAPPSLRLLQEGAYATAPAESSGAAAACWARAPVAAAARLARVLGGGAGMLPAPRAVTLPDGPDAADPLPASCVDCPLAVWPGPTRLSSACRGF